jgi:hypothetical protein
LVLCLLTFLLAYFCTIDSWQSFFGFICCYFVFPARL